MKGLNEQLKILRAMRNEKGCLNYEMLCAEMRSHIYLHFLISPTERAEVFSDLLVIFRESWKKRFKNNNNNNNNNNQSNSLKTLKRNKLNVTTSNYKKQDNRLNWKKFYSDKAAKEKWTGRHRKRCWSTVFLLWYQIKSNSMLSQTVV